MAKIQELAKQNINGHNCHEMAEFHSSRNDQSSNPALNIQV